MRIIISPAKKMGFEAGLAWSELPEFIDRSEVLLERLRQTFPVMTSSSSSNADPYPPLLKVYFL